MNSRGYNSRIYIWIKGNIQEDIADIENVQSMYSVCGITGEVSCAPVPMLLISKFISFILIPRLNPHSLASEWSAGGSGM